MFWVGFFGAVTIENTEGNILTSRSWVADTTQKELKNWLEQTGIEVVLVEAEREKESKMLKDYGQFAQVDADAVLEVAFISIGFVDELGKVDFCWIPPCDSKKPLSPEVLYKYRLVSAKSGEVLVQSNVSYSSFVGQYTGKGVKLLGPEEHIFKGSESVVNQPEEANRRLQHAIEGATELIAKVVTNTYKEPTLEQETVLRAVPVINDFSGTYISSFSGNSRHIGFKGLSPEIKIVQTADQIEGIYSHGLRGRVWGVIEGNTIKFKYHPDGGSTSGWGTWIFTPGSNEVKGTWHSFGGRGEGRWDLTKIE